MTLYSITCPRRRLAPPVAMPPSSVMKVRRPTIAKMIDTLLSRSERNPQNPLQRDATDVRFGSKAEVAALKRDVCFAPESGHWMDIPEGSFCANMRSRVGFVASCRSQACARRGGRRSQLVENGDELGVHR